jgi:glycosyltransferase involved in cell wall biosynthesis
LISLSVLMSARNSEKTIHAAVSSALFSMPTNSELLVLLDACTDNTYQVVAAIDDPRIRIIESHRRLGINQGRNLLIDESVGDFVAVMDSDDICLPWRFIISTKIVKDFDAVFGTAIVFGSRLRPLPILPQLPISLSGESIKLALALANPIVHSTALIRRSALVKIGGYSKAKSEDYELWIRMLNEGLKLKRLGFPLIGYRFHPSQVSQANDFMEQVNSDSILQESLGKLRMSIAKDYLGESGWSPQVEQRIRKLAYKAKPLLKIEHHGLPRFLRNWKNRAISDL